MQTETLRFELINEAQSLQFGQNLARLLQIGDLICFSGDLGAGKSMICRAAIRAFMGDPMMAVPSPTFTLIQHYELQHDVADDQIHDDRMGAFSIYHIDLYRLGHGAEIIELGLEEALEQGALLMEWPEILLPNIGDYLNISQLLRLKIDILPDDRREIRVIHAADNWLARLQSIKGIVPL